MQKQAVEKFGRYRQTLSDALACEDYEDTGILELQQVKEAIASVDEDCDEHLMDWMLYYVYSRSEHVEKMEYKVLINMLDEAIKKDRVQSAKRRPESSNPEKLKQHNRMPAKKEEEDDNYSSDPQIQEDSAGENSPVIKTDKQSNFDESPRQKADSEPNESYEDS
jgi:hypothetical protein